MSSPMKGKYGMEFLHSDPRFYVGNKNHQCSNLGNNNVSNSYLQKLVLCYLKGGTGKTFSEELLQIGKTYSFVSIYQVDDDIIDIIMMITIKFPILWLFFITRG